MVKIYLLLVVVVILSSCSKTNDEMSIKNQDDLLKWMSNEESGLVKKKYVNDLEIKVKYLPKSYLINNEISNQNLSDAQKKEIEKDYENSLTFMLSINPDQRFDKKGGDIIYKDISDYKGYKERIYDLNFQIEEFISISADGYLFSPVLSSFENCYGLKEGRDFIFVFVPENEDRKELFTADKLDFVFEDEFFNTGTNHFIFKREDINKVDNISISNNI
ncbi:MAG: hypothetical protein A2W91_12980 [Bacteroidetes bacterium GWF2_38_335]|nr:MAG: hypothetical protein A2W91_12980 [Bacteroidetes bacterium GWF2_38_335]HBS86938.1 hypothetical protein [Bacteroidales bacterium]